MSKRPSLFSRMFAVFLAVLITANLPVSAFASGTGQTSSISEDMLHNVALDALEYIGYKVSWLRDNNHLYEEGWYGWQAASKTTSTGERILSNVSYGSISGGWTVADSSTVTGLAPNIEYFENYGLDCTGFAEYYYFNYLPNIAGVDTSGLRAYFSDGTIIGRTVSYWYNGAKQAAAAGYAKKIGSTLEDLSRAKIGDLLIFKNVSTDTLQHVAIYVGEHNGKHFMIHVANDRGPELYDVGTFENATSETNKASPLYEIYRLSGVNPLGSIYVNKTDGNGNKLAGAEFTAVNTEDPTLSYQIGPTDANGNAFRNDIEYGTYLITETKYPENYGPSTQTSWTVTVGHRTPTVTVNAENKLKTGYISAQKNDEFGNPLGNVSFGIYSDASCSNLLQIMTTNASGVASSTELDCAKTYYVKETAAQSEDYELNTEVYAVTVAADSTVWVNNGSAITNYLKKGAVGIRKADEFGNPLANVTFGVYSDAACQTKIGEITTDSNGEAVYGKNGNTYTLRCRQTIYLKELNASSSDYVLADTVYPVAVNASTTTYANNGAPVVNYLKNGAVGIKKTNSAGNPLSGVVYGVYSNPACTSQIGTMTTNANGEAIYGQTGSQYTLRCRQTVYLKELQPKDDTYLIDNTVYPVEVKAESVSYANDGTPVVNSQKYWQITVTKKDSENNGLTAGDAGVMGAVYGLYNSNDELLKEYTIGANGSFTTDKYLSGSGYYLKELRSPAGYNIDPAIHNLDNYAAPANLTKELTVGSVALNEIVKTGTVTITKFTADPSNPGVYNVPEKGAEFYIYLKSLGTYENAKSSGDSRVYDYGTVDADGNVIWSNGRAVSKDLAYGTYVVHQVSSWENRILAEDFEVSVENANENFAFNLNNPYYEGTVVINKRDSESGKLITAGEAIFVIRDLSTGKLISWYDKGNDATVTEFVTENGSLTLPMKLPYGTYRIEEIKAPDNYMLSAAPVEFTIDRNHNGLFTFDFENDPLKGMIEIEKTGLQFSTVKEEDSDYGKLYQPVFTEEYIAGVTFHIVADENIVTGDGVVHYKKGDIVDTIVTSGEGHDKSGALYAGKYLVIEYSVPAGFVLNNTPRQIHVTNDGKQPISVQSVAIKNDRVSTEISLYKEVESWVKVHEEKTGFIQRKIEIVAGEGFVFGVFAHEEYEAIDGSKIEKDQIVGLMTTGADGYATFTSKVPFGKYYVKELDTPDTHDYIMDQNSFAADLSVQEGKAKIAVTINGGQGIRNTINKYPITISKTDLASNAPVPGAVIAVLDKDGNVLYQGYTSEEGQITVWLEPGKYTVKEVQAPDGYVATNQVYSCEIQEDGNVLGNLNIKNEKTAFEVLKVDEDGNPLAGAEFTMFDKAGKEVDKQVTDQDGKCWFVGFGKGEYTIKETKAPDGYLLSQEVITLTNDGSWSNEAKSAKATVKNEPIPEPPIEPPTEPPVQEEHPAPTGDKSAISIFVATMLAALAGMVICGATFHIPKRKRKS